MRNRAHNRDPFDIAPDDGIVRRSFFALAFTALCLLMVLFSLDPTDVVRESRVSGLLRAP
jgi:hypothetical protein